MRNSSMGLPLGIDLTTHCTTKEGKKGNVLFNDALNTFYLWLYGVRHMVKDHSDSERGNPLPPHGLLFPISSKDYFICIIPQTVMEHWLEQEIAQWVHPMKDRSDGPWHHERTLLPWRYISLPLHHECIHIWMSGLKRISVYIFTFTVTHIPRDKQAISFFYIFFTSYPHTKNLKPFKN